MRTAAIGVICSALLVASGLHAHAQETFEVASIRRNLTSNQQGAGLAAPQPGGRFVAIGATLRRLVAGAYDDVPVDGGPAWIETDRFDVNARADGEPSPLDRTGLDSAYDLEIEWSSDLGLLQAPRGSAGASELTPDGVSLFTALQDHLGLRLQATRSPVDVIVIESAEPPTPN